MIEEMTAQEIFDTVATHLFTQGEPALGANNVCRYRNNIGLKCAVGCLIPDNNYDVSMEGLRVNGLTKFNIPKFFEDNMDLLIRLQITHDFLEHWVSTERMKEYLRKVAKEYDINYSVLDKLSFEGK